MNQNGLSGTYLGFKVYQNPMAQVSSLYDKWFLKKSKFQAKLSHFVDFNWEKCIKMASVAHI